MQRLEPEQASTIKNLAGMKLALHFIGLEEETNNPVLYVNDQLRKFPMVIGPDGAGYQPRNDVRALTHEELMEMAPEDADILLAIPMALPKPELLEEVWH